MLSLISFHILFPVSYHPPSMLFWSISYRNSALIIWRQICLSVSHLCVQLWLCKSWHIDIKWYRPSLSNLPLRVWHCSRWVINEWLVAGQLLMSYYRPHYSGHFRRLPCWETRWTYSKCKVFICIWAILYWQLRYQHEFGVHIVGRAPPFHGWRFAQLDFFRTNVPVYVAWIRWISSYFYSFREHLLSSPDWWYLKPCPRNHCDDAIQRPSVRLPGRIKRQSQSSALSLYDPEVAFVNGYFVVVSGKQRLEWPQLWLHH